MPSKKKESTLSTWNVKKSQFPKNGKMENRLKFLIKYAILAPSGHNSQPWKFRIDGKKITILPDFERRRAVVDPEDRELFISLGCAAANLEVAAQYFGMHYSKDYEIDEEAGTGSIIFSFKEGKKQSQNEAYFSAITERLTNRTNYLPKQLPKELMESLGDIECSDGVDIAFITQKEVKGEVSELLYKSDRVWFKSKELVNELEGWLRDDVETTKDGLPTGVLNMYKVAVNLKYFLAKDSKEVVNKAERDKELAQKAPVLAVVWCKLDGIEHWIKTGEAYELLALKLTKAGVSHSFFNTVVELKTQRIKLAEILKIKGKPQLFLRLGYSEVKLGHTPRRPLEMVLMEDN
jgi:hypothetical protein